MSARSQSPRPRVYMNNLSNLPPGVSVSELEVPEVIEALDVRCKLCRAEGTVLIVGDAWGSWVFCDACRETWGYLGTHPGDDEDAYE